LSNSGIKKEKVAAKEINKGKIKSFNTADAITTITNTVVANQQIEISDQNNLQNQLNKLFMDLYDLPIYYLVLNRYEHTPIHVIYEVYKRVKL